MKIVDMTENVFQMRTFKDRINVINKSFPNFWEVQCRSYSSAFISLHIIFCCGWRYWASYGNAISLLVKLRIKSVPSGLLKPDWLDQETCLENYGNVRAQGSDFKWYYYLIIFNGNVSDVVGKRGRTLGFVIFILDILDLKMLAMYLSRLYSGEPLYETISFATNSSWLKVSNAFDKSVKIAPPNPFVSKIFFATFYKRQ